jgi:Phosphotransferase enzyme family
MIKRVLSAYGLDENKCVVTPFGNGLINHTWKIVSGKSVFLLQKINQQVFREPGYIMDNLGLLSDYFKSSHPDYLFVAPIHSIDGRNHVIAGNHYYRLFPFIENSYSVNTVNSPGLAFEASRQFGKFTRLLSKFDPDHLHITLPDFHNLTLRFQQFESAIQKGNKKRIIQSAESIRFLQDQQVIVEVFEKIKKHSGFTVRVVHHDAKINNVLFDRRNHQGLCVIDLDTVMPGYYISDVGDMLRTYISPASEEEKDFNKITIRMDYFREIVKGYLGEMQSGLSDPEKQYFVYAGKFAIYMQALRFLTDFLNNDIYYNIQYNDHNLFRADNQIVLLKRFLEKEELLNEILIY